MQQRVSDWVKKFNIAVVPCELRTDHPANEIVFRLKDLFTTYCGQWDVSNNMGSLPQWARDAYLRPWQADDYFDDAGGEQHIFARVLDTAGNPITTKDLVICWSEGISVLGLPDFGQRISMTMTPKTKSGWGNQPVWNKYNPERGECGAWCWCPGGASDVVCGGGLPAGNHISTFAVWQAEARQGPMPVPVDIEKLRTAAWQSLNIVYSGEEALVRYARVHSLGAPLTRETTLDNIRLQGFAGGIVYWQGSDEQSTAHVAW